MSKILAQLMKTEALVKIGRVAEAKAVLSSLNGAHDEDDALAYHQLGNAFLRTGDATSALEAFNRAIAGRERIVKITPSSELRNALAGTYKMRATVYLVAMETIVFAEPELLARARENIDKAVKMRAALVGGEDSWRFETDYAMTLYTRAQISGLTWKFAQALADLSKAAAVLTKHVEEGEAEHLPDLAMCLADVVRYGIGAAKQGHEEPPLALALTCLGLFEDLLSHGNADLRPNFFIFLGHAATPTAHAAGRLDLLARFINAGLDEIDSIREEGMDLSCARPLFAIPSNAILELKAEQGFDRDRYDRLKTFIGL